MERSNNDGKPPARPHWRHRDPSATAVYVVHPTQFRDVVQQLTGAPATATRARDQEDGNGNGGWIGTAAASASNNAAARQQQQHGGGASKGEGSNSNSRQRTLGQIHQECIAWANSDKYDC
jgi:hypothetical protein